MKVVLLTGISGSGKSIAVNALEDSGYYCIDNLPQQFLRDVINSLRDDGVNFVAVAIDARSTNIDELPRVANELSGAGHDVKIIFLNARTDVLVQRYSESRRRHPLALRCDASQEPPTLIESIETEREIMANLQAMGNTLDTSELHPNSLREWLRQLVGADRSPLTLVFQSFAFKYGIPMDADLVFDVRCLPNPHYVPELKPQTGLDQPVADYLGQIPSVSKMIDHISDFLNTWMPSYLTEHRSYLTVGIGCTGGQHRSVYCVETLANRFARTEVVLVRHRGIQMRAHSSITSSQTP